LISKDKARACQRRDITARVCAPKPRPRQRSPYGMVLDPAHEAARMAGQDRRGVAAEPRGAVEVTAETVHERRLWT
jgi:hypothetical protein